MEKTYTKQEVLELVEPLMKQIQFYNSHCIALKEYIRKPWWSKPSKISFLKQIMKSEDESDTLIFNLVQLSPEQIEFLRNWYDRHSPTNN